MAIYTKTGDKGTTKVFDNKSGELVSVPKESCQIQTIGDIDELNSFLGIVISEVRIQKSKIAEKNIQDFISKLREIQSNLFTINSILAGSDMKFDGFQTRKLEREIDEMEGILPVQKNFIYYSGSRVSTKLFYARALCRRAERTMVSLAKERQISQEMSSYLNRLSDYLFMLARKVNFDLKVKESFWITQKSK